MPTLTADLLLFDLDGTLVDSRRNVEAMWRAWCEKEGVDPERLLAVYEGRQGKSVVAELAPHLDPESEDEWIIRYQLEQTGGVDPVAGVHAMINRLSSDGWAIVTSCTRALAASRLRAAALPDPPLLVSADDISRSKPDPEGFLLASDRCGVPPRRCVVFEDSVAGLNAAAAAGMAAVNLTAATRDTPDAELQATDWTEVAIEANADGTSRWTVTLPA